MTTARDLASNHFVRIGEAHSTAEAVGIIFDPQSSNLREIVIVVLDPEGHYLGLVEPRNLLRSLGTELSAAGAEPSSQVAAIRRALSTPVSDVARRDIPAAHLDDNLATLLVLAAQTEAATIPVFDGEEFVGIVPLTSIFEALCQLTLSSGGEDLPFMKAGR